MRALVLEWLTHLSDGPRSEWTADALRGLVRVVTLAGGVGLVVVALLAAVPAWRARGIRTAWLWLFDLPQAAMLAMPLAITAGVFWGVDGRPVTWRLRKALLGLALLGSALSFATAGWLVPAAHRQWNLTVADLLRPSAQDVGPGSFPSHGGLEPGPDALTLTELLARRADPTALPFTRKGRDLAVAYQTRWALPVATFVITAFSLATVTRRRSSVLARGMSSVCTVGAYWVLWATAEFCARQGTLAVVAAIWLPNLAFLGATLAVAVGRGRATLSADPR